MKISLNRESAIPVYEQIAIEIEQMVKMDSCLVEPSCPLKESWLRS